MPEVALQSVKGRFTPNLALEAQGSNKTKMLTADIPS